MNANQSLHLVVKDPPSPQPAKSLGIFTELDDPELPSIIMRYLNGTIFELKSDDFKANVRTEVLRLLERGTVISVARQQETISIIIRLAKEHR